MDKIIHMQLKEKKPVSVSVDSIAKALYIAFSNNPVCRTVKKDSSFFIDYDKDNNIVGFEIIRLKKLAATMKLILKETESTLPPAYRKSIEQYLQPL